MVRPGACLIIANHAPFTDSPGMALPKSNIGCAVGENCQVDPNDCTQSQRQPKPSRNIDYFRHRASDFDRGLTCRLATASIRNQQALKEKNSTARFLNIVMIAGQCGCAAQSHVPSNQGLPQTNQYSEYTRSEEHT